MMGVRLIVSIILIFTTYLGFGQNYYLLRGYVYGVDNTPLVGAYVRVQQTSLGTVTDSEGKFELRLLEGLQRLVISHVGFESQKTDLVLLKDEALNIWLQPSDLIISEVSVSASNKGLGHDIMQKVIGNKDNFTNISKPYRSQLYIKSLEELLKSKDREKINDPASANLPETQDKITAIDSSPEYNFYESFITYDWQNDKNTKQERTAVKKIGSQRNLFYTNTTDGNLSVYQNLIFVPKLGDKVLVSPLNDNAFLSYKFKLVESYFDSTGQKVYRIKVIPRASSNGTMQGELFIIDETWFVQKASLTIPQKNLINYDDFSFDIEYRYQDSTLITSTQRFTWNRKENKQKIIGTTEVTMLNLTTDTAFHKRYFSSELGSTSKDAYKRVATYWDSIRPIPLSQAERSFLVKEDSLLRVRNSKVYLDSVDAVFNKITFQKVLWKGVGYINREKKETWDFGSLINLLDPLAIGGWRVKYGMNFSKRFENRKYISVSPFLNYGFLNKDIKGSLNVYYLYDPIKQSSVSVSAGKYFDFVNGFATLSDVARRSNFYVRSYGRIGLRRELFNGFYTDGSISFERREDLGNFKFAAIGDSLFENNIPVLFSPHKSAKFGIGIEYTPKQLYLKEPNEKIILGSRYPTIYAGYERATPNVFGSVTSFDYVNFGFNQSFNIGVIGNSSYSVNTGRFLSKNRLELMDYLYVRGGDKYLFTPPMYTFQLIDSTFTVFDWKFAAHYEHQFNGFIISKIPLLKKSGMRTMAGSGFLYVPEHKFQYSELFAGVNRVFRLGREYFRLGIYYVAAQSNQQGISNQIKFSIEPYNRDKNTWSF